MTNHIGTPPRERLHEVVDAVLYCWDLPQPPAVEPLDAILEHAGTAYRVDDSGRQLVLRVDPTVEAAFRRAAEADNTRASLGTVCRDLTNQRDKWELLLVDDKNRAAGIEAFVGLLNQLWQGQRSRHGGGRTSRDQTQGEAEAAVHLAGLAVQWLRAGVLRGKTS